MLTVTGPAPSAAFAAEFDHALAVQLGRFQPTQLALEHRQGGVLGSAGRLAHFLHVRDVQIDQVAKVCRRLARTGEGASPLSILYSANFVSSVCTVRA